MVIKRDIYLNKLLSKKNNGLIKVITGLRRCGKSFLLFELFKNQLLEEGISKDHIIEMSFDSFENEKYCNAKVFFNYVKKRIKDSKSYYVLLDEIQLLKNFESVLNSFLRMKNIDIYVTGSNAKFLSKDVITEFRGRGDEVHMYPLSFSEFVSVYNDDKQKAWKEYILFGGLPLIFNFKTDEQKSDFLKSIFKETYISDIIGRNKIRNKAELEEIVNILSSSIGSLTNPRKLSSTFQSIKKKTISPTTIKKYIDSLSDSFLIDSAIRFDIKGKKYIDTPLKYYFSDLGLRNAVLNFRQIEETHSMENIIFNELKIRGYNIDIGLITTNEVDKNGKKIRKQREIDFVCNKFSNRYYIQCTLNMPDANKREQEQKPLLLTSDGFKKIIITKDALAPLYNEKGILIMNIFDFLLNTNSLEL